MAPARFYVNSQKMWVAKNTIKPCTSVRISPRISPFLLPPPLERILPSFVFQLRLSLQQLPRNKKAAFTSTPRRGRVLIRITRVPFFSSSTPFSNRDWETRIGRILIVKVGNTPNLEFLSPLYIYIVPHTLGSLSSRRNSWQGSLPARWARKRGSESSNSGAALRRTSKAWV